MNEINLEIAKQINAKELKFAGFLLISDDKNNALIINKGVKAIKIKYDIGKDTYILTKIKNGNVLEVLDDVYFDSLKSVISEFFKFEYVMEGLLRLK